MHHTKPVKPKLTVPWANARDVSQLDGWHDGACTKGLDRTQQDLGDPFPKTNGISWSSNSIVKLSVIQN